MADTCILVGTYRSAAVSNGVTFATGQMTIITPSTPLTDLPNWYPTDTSVGLDAASDGVKLWYPTKATATDSVQLRSQKYPAPKNILNQVKHELSSGKVSIYKRTNTNRIIPVNIEGVSTTQRMRLYIFLVNICDGAIKTFEFEDEGGNLYLVRWWDDISDMPMVYWLDHLVEINLRKEVV